MRSIKVKLCGFTKKESLRVAIESRCDFIGFVFCETSPRYITPESAAELAAEIPDSISTVAVLVNPEISFLEKISQTLAPDFFQFHGDEDVNFLRNVRQNFPNTKIIKAFRPAERETLNAKCESFEGVADFFLFDSATPGSGTSFNWEVLKNLSSKKGWFLSGGLNINNIEEALRITEAKMIDISSGIEKSRGEKSPELIRELMTKIKNVSQDS